MTFDQVLSRRLARLVTAEPDWDQVYAEELPRVFNFFRYRLGDCADAEDLTARTFEQAWQARHRYRSDVAGFATWLLTIARNIAIDHQRPRQRYQPLDVAAAVPVPDDRPEPRAVQQSESQRLAALVATLAPRQRELIAMKYGADMTNPAIARATGLSESNVGTILHRAVESLRALVRSANMSNDAWLHALRSDPSPLFKEQLRARLIGNEPGLSEGPRTGDVTAARPIGEVSSIASAGRRSESR